MKDILLAKRYAKALFDLAREKGEMDKVKSDLSLVSSTIEESMELRHLLANPFVSDEHKFNIFKQLFGSQISALTLTFLNVLLEKNREDQLQYIAIQYNELYLNEKNLVVVKVVTAVPVDDETLKHIAAKVADKTTKTMQIENEVDKDIIGGYILNINDYQYDASIKTMMSRLHKSFDKNLFIKGY